MADGERARRNGPKTLTERVAVLEQQFTEVLAETRRLRDFRHDYMESDHATLKLLVGQVTELTRGIETIAHRAAEAAVSAFMERRADRDEERMQQIAKNAAEETLKALHEQRQTRSARRVASGASLVGAGVALGGFVFLLVDKF